MGTERPSRRRWSVSGSSSCSAPAITEKRVGPLSTATTPPYALNRFGDDAHAPIGILISQENGDFVGYDGFPPPSPSPRVSAWTGPVITGSMRDVSQLKFFFNTCILPRHVERISREKDIIEIVKRYKLLIREAEGNFIKALVIKADHFVIAVFLKKNKC